MDISEYRYNGRTYRVTGQLNGVAYDVGTLLGPDLHGRYHIVIASDPKNLVAKIGRAQPEDMIQLIGAANGYTSNARAQPRRSSRAQRRARSSRPTKAPKDDPA